MKVHVFSIERMYRGYLASNQLMRLVSASPVHFSGTVATNLSEATRNFSWLWVRRQKRAVLINRTTGTAYDPKTGQGINSAPRILEAPVDVPQFDVDEKRQLPVGVFSTAER